jgi:hypothetical protein
MSRITHVSGNGRSDSPVIQLNLELREPLLVAYFEPYAEPERSARALEALKVAVIALQTATPTLDTQIVKDQFAEMQQDFGEALNHYFAEKGGILPKSLNDAFGDKGALSQFFLRYFDPETGRLVRLLEGQVGPSSRFARLFDPKNKDGVIAVIEDKVKQLVEAKLNEVLTEFSFDDQESFVSRLMTRIDSAASELREALGAKAARAEEAQRGHVKGFSFEEDLYDVVAEMGRQFGDATELVRGIPGSSNKCKTGDHLITLGETTGAPGQRIVVEVKDQTYKAKEAIAELQKAKKNREALSGIFVFAKGCEPREFGDFHRIDNDFYCTVDKSALTDGEPLLFLWAAYQISRVQAVVAVRKEAAGKLDLERIEQHIEGISLWVPRVGEIIKKAQNAQNTVNGIETIAKAMTEDIKQRVAEVFALLRRDGE